MNQLFYISHYPNEHDDFMHSQLMGGKIWNIVKKFYCCSIFLNKKSVYLKYDNTSEIRGLCLMKCSSKCFKNCPIWFFQFFISCCFIFTFFECPGLCWHGPGHSLGKNKVARNEKYFVGVSYPKNMANFEALCWNISSSTNILFLKSDNDKLLILK